MYETLLDWVLSIPQILAQFATWLLQPLPVINMNPLALLSVGGITIVIFWHLTRLIVGG